MADNRITKKRVKNHLAYGWWKYLLALALCVMGVDLAFAMTAYRPPEEKKIELYILNDYLDAPRLQADLWPEIVSAHPEQEELTVLNINLTGGDMYASMQFSTYAAASQGDVCLLPRSEVKKLAAEGADNAFLELSPYIKSGVIDASGIDLSAGRMKSASGEWGVYGIPADGLYGLTDYGNNPADSLLCVMGYSGNEDVAASVINLLLSRYAGEKPAQPAGADAAPVF